MFKEIYTYAKCVEKALKKPKQNPKKTEEDNYNHGKPVLCLV